MCRLSANAVRYVAILVSFTGVAGAAWASDPGPGFGISRYQVIASAHGNGTGVLDVNSTPASTAHAAAGAAPFGFGEASQQGLHSHAEAGSSCCGGAGAAGASASGKILFTIKNGAPGTIYDLTFFFSSGFGIAAAGNPGSIGAATIHGDYILGSDRGTASSTANLSGTAQGTNAFHVNSTNGFDPVSVTASGSQLDFITSFTGNIKASQYVIAEESFGVDTEFLGSGYIIAFGNAQLTRVTVPRDFIGSLPVLSSPGNPDIPVTLAVPEPVSWAMILMGFGLIGSALRRNRTIRFANAA